MAAAWLVIQNCGQGDNRHPFRHLGSQPGRGHDSWGNYMPSLDAFDGQQFRVPCAVGRRAAVHWMGDEFEADRGSTT